MHDKVFFRGSIKVVIPFLISNKNKESKIDNYVKVLLISS